MRILSVAILLLAIGFLSGCDSGPELIDGQPPTYDPFELFSANIQPLEGELGIDFDYARDSDFNQVSPNRIEISFVTDHIYECANYSIVYTVATTRYSIILTIYGIRGPEICLTAEGPARASSEFDVPFGSYRVLIRYRDMVDQYGVYLRENSMGDSRVSTSFTHFAP